MVKSKKMSKTSIAVIVLALLLVLSMVMGITGAWFTDNDSQNPAATNIQFGKVNIQIAEDSVAVSPASGVTIAKLLPGDEFDLAGQVTDSADVDMYVYVAASTEFVINGNKYYELYAAAEGGSALVSVDALKLVESGANVADAANWHLVGKVYASQDAQTADIPSGLLYKVDAAAATANFAGHIEISEETPNVVYGKIVGNDGVEAANRTSVTLNDVDTFADIQGSITLGMQVKAVQYKYIAEDTAQNDELDIDDALTKLGVAHTYYADLTQNS